LNVRSGEAKLLLNYCLLYLLGFYMYTRAPGAGLPYATSLQIACRRSL